MASLKSRSVTRTSVSTSRELPHIITGKLYPAWEGLLEDNTAFAFADSSASARTITAFGSVHHTGSQEKIGSTSIVMDGLISKLVLPASTDWDLPNDTDWTLELWMWSRTPTTAWTRIISKDGDNDGWALHMNNNTGQIQMGDDSTSMTSDDLVSNSNSAITAGTWTHIAVVHNNSANSLVLYKDGTAVITKTAYNGSQPIQNWWTSTNEALLIGNRYENAYYFDGYMDEIRIVVGTAVYTGNFAAPTALTTTGGTYSSGTNVNTSFTAANTKLLIHSDNGGHVGDYGTTQSDGLKYYYTDIKGSKPIKDPRIGAYYGSQRHKFKSLQVLEQETGALRGNNVHDLDAVDVYSIDGREWCRTLSSTATVQNHNHGNDINISAIGDFVEFTGYFNDFSVTMFTYSNRNADIDISVNGTLMLDGNTILAGDVSYASNGLMGRYLDPHSLINAGNITCNGPGQSGSLTSNLGTAPKINTVRFEIRDGSLQTNWGAIELIAQDTTSTANRSKIQIPSQNVVSFGKKFTVSGTPHYDPFNGFTNSADSHSSYVDTATSLGLSGAPGLSKGWSDGASSTTTHIRPFNGGRVIKWVDATGAIKTSVTMMPPNAQNHGPVESTVSGQTRLGLASNEITTPSATNTVTTPCFSDDPIEHSLSEVAKTYHVREFGNGSANGGSDGASYDDASMISQANTTGNDIGYVMADGLTSFCAKKAIGDSYQGEGITLNAQDDSNWFFTFIGTGFSFRMYQNNTLSTTHDLTVDGVMVHDSPGAAGIVNYTAGGSQVYVCQNLPYGTHVVKRHRVAASGWNYLQELTIYQPKMPPIPENAVVISDYMLMADFVAAGATNSQNEISKGVRRSNCSRDWYYGLAASVGISTDSYRMPRSYYGTETASNFNTSLPYFGTHAVFENHPHSNRMNNAVLSGSTQSLETNIHIHISESTMGFQDATIVGSQSGEYVSIPCIDMHTPIHTSSHYQSFETPFLYELIGGDRNVEQTNLVVTPDGKTWDEVTRDTSYIGKECVHADFAGSPPGLDAICYFDDYRGNNGTSTPSGGTGWNLDNYYTKDWAICYDRFICLVPGNYSITVPSMAAGASTGGAYSQIFVNGTRRIHGHCGTSGYSCTTPKYTQQFKRGDQVQIKGHWRAELYRSGFFIERN